MLKRFFMQYDSKVSASTALMYNMIDRRRLLLRNPLTNKAAVQLHCENDCRSLIIAAPAPSSKYFELY
jgi:hypothetical protein